MQKFIFSKVSIDISAKRGETADSISGRNDSRFVPRSSQEAGQSFSQLEEQFWILDIFHELYPEWE